MKHQLNDFNKLLRRPVESAVDTRLDGFLADGRVRCEKRSLAYGLIALRGWPVSIATM